MSVVTQIISSDSASGAQVIDGSLKFNGGYLTRTPSSDGNRRKWTHSCWVKFDDNDAQSEPLLVAGDSSSDFTQVYTFKSKTSDIALTAKTSNSDKVEIASNNVLRDTEWYHIVTVFDSTGSGYQTASTIYVNGEEISRNTNTFAGGQNYESWVNSSAEPHYLGYLWNGNTFKGHMSQVYLIDGQALGPGYFGFTDPLTGTWRPKKFKGSGTTVNDGTQWSSLVDVSNATVNNGSAANLFDGDITTKINITAGYIEIDLSSRDVQAGPEGIEVYNNEAGVYTSYQVNGGEVINWQGSAGWMSMGGVNSKINTIRINYITGGGVNAAFAFRVNGVIMVDSTTQNVSLSKSYTDYTGVFAPYSTGSRAAGVLKFGTVVEDATSYTLPMSNPAHYGGKATDLQTGGFQIELNNTTAYKNFMMGMWVKFDTYAVANQFGLNIAGNYVYFETRSSGAVKVRHTGDAGATGSPTSLGDGNWHHVVLSRTHNTVYGIVDGSIVTSSGISGLSGVDSVPVGTKLNFWGAEVGSGYNIDGQIIDPFFYAFDDNRNGASTFSTPTAPLIDSSGNINHFTDMAIADAYYISPSVTISGSSPNGIPNAVETGTNSFYLPMDGNTLIGEDQSGNNNDFTPVNFLNPVAVDLDKATGALPILNTTQGGTQAGPGVFGSKQNKHRVVTTANGSHYKFDNGENNPSLSFVRGATYAFDYSSFSGHPLLFSSSDPQSSVTAYTTGTNISSNVIKITVPHDAPSTLYYYCQNHPGSMYGSISVTTDASKTDPYAANCVLANPLVGNINDVSHLINCTTTEKAMTNVGSAVASRNGNYYNGSWNFDYVDDQITTPDTTDFSFGSGEFCMECWFYQTGQASWNYLIGQYGSNYTTFYALNSNKLYCYFYYSGTSFILQDPGTLEPNQWVHTAVTRDSSNKFRLFINGKVVDSTTQSVTLDDSDQTFSIGSDSASNYHFQGQIQDVRVYKGVAKYSTGATGEQVFNPGTTDRSILPDTPSGVSGRSKLTKITDGAVAFDGSSDSLKVNDSSDLAFGTGEFTVEMFFYANTVSGNDVLYDSRAATGNPTDGFSIVRNNDQLRTYTSGAYQITPSTFRVASHRWYHLAITRESTTQKMYIDGVLVGSATVSNDFSQNKATIGSDVNTGESWDGFISNFRLIKGTALYTTDFDPPTTPLTNVTNTKLLCCQSPSSTSVSAVVPTSGLNNGTVWSDYLTTTTGTKNIYDFYTGNNYPATNLFDGDTSSIVYGGWVIDNSNLIFRPPSGITVASSLEVYVGYYDKIKVNGSDYNTAAGADAPGWVTVSDGSNFTGSLTELILENRTNANVVRAAAIRIDSSTILIDSIASKGGAYATTFSPFNTDINTVRGQETHYPTWSPLVASTSSFSDGNLKITTQAANYVNDLVTMRTPAGTGKWYWEFVQTARTGTDYTLVGMLPDDNTYQQGISDIPQNCGGIGLYIGHNGYPYVHSGAATSGDSTATFDVGDVLGWAFDAENGTVKCFKNGVSQGTQYRNVRTDTGWTFCVTDYDHTTVSTFEINFGQKPFKYSPPDGFQPLNISTIQPEKVIARPDQYFAATAYTGNGGTQSINAGLKPDLVWIKRRTPLSDHQLYDSVRGTNKGLTSDQTFAQWDYGNGLMSFDPKGFTLGALGGANTSNQTHVAWCWKAGGSSNNFNVDGYGYASAADVGMDIGGRNPFAYNTSQTWSSYYDGAAIAGTHPIANAFDGSRTTHTITNSLQQYLSVDLENITVTDRVEIRGEIGFNTPACSVTIGGITHQIGGDPYSLTSGTAGTTSQIITNVSGPLTNVTVGRVSSGRTFLSQIVVDGKILVDTGTTLPQIPSIASVKASVGTEQGFSIVQYQGNSLANQSIAHGLTKRPDFSIFKNMDTASNWTVWHKDLGYTTNSVMYLNAGGPVNTYSGSNTWWYQLPDDQLFYIGDTSNAALNNGVDDIISYHWHDVPGLQKFGIYRGNSSTDGPFIELGFRPALFVMKQANSTGYWMVYDSARDPINDGSPNYLFWNDGSAEGGGYDLDFLSNGVKLRTNNANFNTTSYIYAAWAESPQSNLFGGQSNAR